jgi:hypothetical protein
LATSWQKSASFNGDRFIVHCPGGAANNCRAGEKSEFDMAARNRSPFRFSLHQWPWRRPE